LGQWTVLNHYGANNKSEFFAVTSESFFEKPSHLQRTHPELYDLLRRYYRIDPLEWVN
jgi:Mlc titration factor MtfA (ptsG expression regulator)